MKIYFIDLQLVIILIIQGVLQYSTKFYEVCESKHFAL